MYQWRQLADHCNQNNLKAHLSVMSSDRLRVGMVQEFTVRHGIVRITFVVRRPVNSGGDYTAGVVFDDRLHGLRANPPNRFFMHGIDGLGSLVFKIIDADCSYLPEVVRPAVLKTGWSYSLEPEQEADTNSSETHLKPVN